MNLFDQIENINLLPCDGTVNYYGKIINQTDANNYTKLLLENIEWKHDEAIIFGKKIITKRKVAWYGDEGFSYTYSKVTKHALTWTKELLELKKIAEDKTGVVYNSCLLNLYHDGDEGMAWHSDGEKELLKNGCIASFSFGAERKFMFKHKQSAQTVSMMLENGSLLAMRDETQSFWLHRLAKSTKVKTARVNLTFRIMNKK